MLDFTGVLFSHSKPLESAETSTFFMQSCLHALPRPQRCGPNSSAPDTDLHLSDAEFTPQRALCAAAPEASATHPIICSSTIYFVLTTVSHSLTLCRAENANAFLFSCQAHPGSPYHRWGSERWCWRVRAGLYEACIILLSNRPPSTLSSVSQGCLHSWGFLGSGWGCRETGSRVPETHQHTQGSTRLMPGFPQSLPRAAGRATEPLRQCWGKGSTCIALTQSQKWWVPGMMWARGHWEDQQRGHEAGEVQDTRQEPRKTKHLVSLGCRVAAGSQRWA